jgi:hypothetical protein
MFTVTTHIITPKTITLAFFFELIWNAWQHTNASDRLQTTVLKFVNFYVQVSTHTWTATLTAMFRFFWLHILIQLFQPSVTSWQDSCPLSLATVQTTVSSNKLCLLVSRLNAFRSKERDRQTDRQTLLQLLSVLHTFQKHTHFGQNKPSCFLFLLRWFYIFNTGIL